MSDDEAADQAELAAARAKLAAARRRWPRLRELSKAITEMRQENNFAARLEEAYRT